MEISVLMPGINRPLNATNPRAFQKPVRFFERFRLNEEVFAVALQNGRPRTSRASKASADLRHLPVNLRQRPRSATYRLDTPSSRQAAERFQPARIRCTAPEKSLNTRGS